MFGTLRWRGCGVTLEDVLLVHKMNIFLFWQLIYFDIDIKTCLEVESFSWYLN